MTARPGFALLENALHEPSEEQKERQEMFDIVLRELVRQGKPSLTRWNYRVMCAYRGDENRRCAIGWLLRPGESLTEGFPFDQLDDRAMPNRFRRHRGFLSRLQHAHDHDSTSLGEAEWVRQFKLRMRKVAGDFGLAYSLPEEVA